MNRIAFLICLCFTASILAQDRTTSDIRAALAMENAMVDAIAKAERSVVAIIRANKDERADKVLADDYIPQEFGTGVVVGRDGLILTNYHVLGNVEKSQYVVKFDHRPYPAKILAADPWSDLAILKVEADNLQPISFGDTSNLRKGKFVIALGNPYAIAKDGSASATWGIIANLDRKAAPHLGQDKPDSKETIHHFGTLIQTDARLKLGTSGGPLLNLRGEMIGLTTSLAALSGYERSTGFAVPVNDMFKRVVKQLKAGKEVEYGFLGVASAQIAAVDRRDGKHGVRLEAVVSASPAGRADLVEGDIVTHIDDQPIFESDDLFRRVGSLAAGDKVALRVEREISFGRTTISTKEVALSKKYVSSHRPVLASQPAMKWRGIQVDYASATFNFATRSQIGGVDPDGCIGVVLVDKGTPGWVAGIRPGMYISHVDGKRVTNAAEFFAAAKKSRAVRLRRVLVGKTDTLTVAESVETSVTE